MIEKRATTRKPRATGGDKGLRLGPALMARLDALAAFTEVPGQLTRRYLTRAHVAAMGQVRAWMEEAGMSVRTDALCSVFGRYEARTRGRQQSCSARTSIPSWMRETTMASSACSQRSRWSPSWRDKGERLEHAIEVAAFGEEEGSRFSAHILTSSALIGAVKPALLDLKDSDGISVREALAAAGGDAEGYRACVRKKGEIAAYLELHIEQGPVLDDKGLALAAVTAINGSMRVAVTVAGFAGHAGTVPMGSRRDALAAASEMILAIERLGGRRRRSRRHGRPHRGLAGRDERDPRQRRVHGRHAQPVRLLYAARVPARLALDLREIAARRRVEHRDRHLSGEPGGRARSGASSRPCAGAIAACGQEPMRLSSGAGHDARIMAEALPVRHDVRALQGRHQPQPGRVDHGGGRRPRRARRCWKPVRRLDERLAADGADDGARRRQPRSPAWSTRTSTRRWRSCRSWCACRPTRRRATTRRMPSAPPSCWRPWASRPSAIPCPPRQVRAAGLASLTNLIVRAALRRRARRSRSTRTATWCRRARAGPADPYGGEIEDGRMYGRGVAVCKSRLRHLHLRAARARGAGRGRSPARSSCTSPTTRNSAACSAPAGCCARAPPSPTC